MRRGSSGCLIRRVPFTCDRVLIPPLWSWCWQFFRHANAQHVNDTKQLLADISPLESRCLFLDRRRGAEVRPRPARLDGCRAAPRPDWRTRRRLPHWPRTWVEARCARCRARVRELDPDAQMDIAGAVVRAGLSSRSTRFPERPPRRYPRKGGRFSDEECTGFERSMIALHRHPHKPMVKAIPPITSSSRGRQLDARACPRTRFCRRIPSCRRQRLLLHPPRARRAAALVLATHGSHA